MKLSEVIVIEVMSEWMGVGNSCELWLWSRSVLSLEPPFGSEEPKGCVRASALTCLLGKLKYSFLGPQGGCLHSLCLEKLSRRNIGYLLVRSTEAPSWLLLTLRLLSRIFYCISKINMSEILWVWLRFQFLYWDPVFVLFEMYHGSLCIWI